MMNGNDTSHDWADADLWANAQGDIRDLLKNGQLIPYHSCR